MAGLKTKKSTPSPAALPLHSSLDMTKLWAPCLVAVALFFVTISSAESQTSGGAILTVQPPATEINDVSPGASLNLAIKLKNSGTVAGSWYTEKSVFTIENGQSTFIPNSENQDIASWMIVQPGPLSVQPGETVTVEVEIKVPANATSGAHHGAIFFSESKPGTNPSVSKIGSLFIVRVEGGSRDTNIDFNQEEESNHFVSSDPAAGSWLDRLLGKQ